MTKQETKNIINSYLDFECPGTDGELEKPFVIVAPARGDASHLRIYAYGGSAGGIGCSNKAGCITASPKYEKYLKSTYPDGHENNYAVPPWLSIENPVALWAERSKLPFDGEKYLSLVAAALQNRSKYHDERREQTRIAHKFMSVNPGESMLVTDIEYVAPKLFTGKVKKLVYDAHERYKKGKKGRESLLKLTKPDFILFDGKSFGIVEFKYNGKSMDGDNSLREHMLDFANVLAEEDDASRKLRDWVEISDNADRKAVLDEEGRGGIETTEKIRQSQWELFNDCCKNMRTLRTYGLISENWEDSLKSMEEIYDNKHDKAFDPDLLWCGFLFVGGKKDSIKEEIRDQLKGFENSALDIRYQYSEEFPKTLTMDTPIRDILCSQ